MSIENAAHEYSEYGNPLMINPDRGLPDSVAIIGGGTIGPDIGYFFKQSIPSIDLVIVDISEDALDNARVHITELVEKGIQHNKINEDQKEELLNIKYTTEYEAISDADLVIEAVTENVDLKRNVMEQVENQVDEDCIIASNTSTLPAERIFSDVDYPNRTTVTHFFAPAWRNPLVEIIKWDDFSKDSYNYLFWLFGTLGKLPIVVEDEIAFALDRVFNNWCNESVKLLDTATASEVDSVAEEYVSAGPFHVLNLSNGNPVIAKSSSYLAEENDAYQPANIFESVDEWNTKAPGSKYDVSSDIEDTIRNKLLGVLFSQSTNIVDRQIATKADLNIGCEAALGFTEGPFNIMNKLGNEMTDQIVEDYSSTRPDMPTPKEKIDEYGEFYRHVILDKRDGVLVVTIRRPHKHNTLNLDAFSEIEHILRKYEDDPSIAGFVLTGYGPNYYSSGFEIDQFLSVIGDKDQSRELIDSCTGLFSFMDQMSTPVVAAINGPALGGGFELALRCHKIVSKEDAYFEFPEVTLGIFPAMGGIVIPFRRFDSESIPKFLDMIRYNEQLAAIEASELNIVSQVVQDENTVIDAAIEEALSLEGSVQPWTSALSNPADVGPLSPDTEPVSSDGMPLSSEVDNIICTAVEGASKEDSLEEALEVGYSAFGEVVCTEAADERISDFTNH